MQHSLKTWPEFFKAVENIDLQKLLDSLDMRFNYDIIPDEWFEEIEEPDNIPNPEENNGY